MCTKREHRQYTHIYTHTFRSPYQREPRTECENGSLMKVCCICIEVIILCILIAMEHENEPSNFHFHESDNFGFLEHSDTPSPIFSPTGRYSRCAVLPHPIEPLMCSVHCPLPLSCILYIFTFDRNTIRPLSKSSCSSAMLLFRLLRNMQICRHHCAPSTRTMYTWYGVEHALTYEDHIFFAKSRSSVRLGVSSLEIETKQIKSFGCTRRHTNLN